MPYAPGIQDISGQLIAQGMSQAGAARARAIESIGESIAGGMRQYQQNQLFTNQALGKFGSGLQDPTFKQYVQQIVNDDPNAPQVPEALKKAFKNAQAGKVDIYDAALLGTAAEGYQQNKMRAAQIRGMESEDLLRQAQILELFRKGSQPSYVMSQQELQRIYPRETYDVSGLQNVPGMPGMVDLSKATISTRGPQQPIAPTVIPAGGAVILDPISGRTRFVQGAPKLGEGEILQMPEQAEEKGRPPAALPQFLPSGSMAPGAAPKETPAAAPAEAIAAVAAAQGQQAPALPRIVKLEGSQAAEAVKEKRQKEMENVASRIAESERALSMIDEAIEKGTEIMAKKPTIDPTGVGPQFRALMTEAADFQALVRPISNLITVKELQALRASGSTLGQVAVREFDALGQLLGNLSLEQSTPQLLNKLRSVKGEFSTTLARLRVLKRDMDAGRSEPSKEYYDMAGRKVENVRKMNVSVGKQPGQSRLSNEASMNEMEGKVVRNTKTGQRYRIKNGQPVLID